MLSRVEDVVRSKPARLLLISGLALFGAWSFAPHLVNDVSTRAAVNAPLVRLTAAVDGTVAPLPAVGRYFDATVELPLVAPSGDTGAVAQIAADADLAQATLALAERQLAELGAEEARLVRRSRLFAAATAERLAADHVGATAAARACAAEEAERRAALARAEKLVESGFMSPAGLERARSAAALAQGNCESGRAALTSIGAMRAAARQGIYIGDSYNDAPYADQQRDRLLLQRQELEQRAVEARARLAEARRRLAEVKSRVQFRAAPGTLVWAQLSSPGAAVRAGEPVLDLVDCGRRFVEVALPERRAEAIRPGDAAEVRLIGSDQWQTGRVSRIVGAAARRSDTLLAATTLSALDERELSVEVRLPPPTPGSADRRCAVGRLAEVRFGQAG